jgi:hypothetical protein
MLFFVLRAQRLVEKIDVRCVVSGSEEPDRYATADNNDV